MNCRFTAMLFILVLTFTGFFSWAAEESVDMHFEPELTLCEKNENGFMECRSLSTSGAEFVKIALQQRVQIGDIEAWSGEYTKELQDKSFQASFQVQVTLQKLRNNSEKIYEFIFLMKNSMSGASRFSVAVSDPAQLNFSKIQLPEVKDGDRSFLISLTYGPAQVNKENRGIPLVEIDGREHYMMGDLLVEKNSLGEVNIEGSRPVKVDLWEDGVMPIVFKSDVSQKIRDLIWGACKEWSAVANVKCVPGPYKNRELVVSTSYLGIDGGCWSMLGQSTYFLWLRRRMNIGEGCDKYATILHELGHAFGLGHEHQRPDRDSYIEILTDNIKDPFFGLQTKVNFSTQEGQLLGPYDFLSIMHYPRKAGSKNDKDTIVPRPDYQIYIDQMGKVLHLSEMDKLSLQKLYGAPSQL